MSILLKAAKILDPGSSFHLQRKDILIEHGQITAIQDEISGDYDQEIASANLTVSAGWFDMRAHFQDPGLEYKEDIDSGMRLAQASGFTDVAVLPNTDPVITTKNDITYLKKSAEPYVAHLHPMAAVTKAAKGEELTEMIDLHHAGAVAFTDGLEPIWHTDILLKSLQYLQQFGGLLINRPEDKWLTMFGHMNEGVVSTMLGMKGMPALAEEVMIRRDLMLLEYAGGRIHFSGITSRAALEIIREAKKKGLQVTCDVPVYHLLFDESHVDDYDTNFKVNPPLRTSDDLAAIAEAIKDHTIDAIVSNHLPQDQESKQLEFDLADFGMISMQTFLPMLLANKGNLTLEDLLGKITTGPRQIFGAQAVTVDEGATASLTIFDPDKSWLYDARANLSKSGNSPLLGKELKGQVLGIINGSKTHFNIA